MTKQNSVFDLLRVAASAAALFIGVAMGVACGDDGGSGTTTLTTTTGPSTSGGTNCVPNETQACDCPDGSTGAETCLPDGSAFGECECGGGTETGGACNTPFTDCDGVCVDTDKDAQNCGACGTACSAGEICDGGGNCAVSCQTGLEECDGTCTDVGNDPANCGGCGSACAGGEVCSSGACATSCPAGTVDCGGSCIDPNTDENFCGASGDCMGGNEGVACGAGEVCDGTGVCSVNCQMGLLNCDGTCVDPNTDENYCGATDDCMGMNAGTICGGGELCDGMGNCTLSCQMGLIDCDGTCVDPNTDENYCGASGDCMGMNAGAVCGAGEVCDGMGSCAVTCQMGLLECMGECIDPDSNPMFCGASGDCMGMNAGQACAGNEACVAGQCQELAMPLTCQMANGFTWCYHPSECGQPCNPTCAAVGLTPLADQNAWFNAQNENAECGTLRDAFGLNNVQMNSYTYACLEDGYGTHADSTPMGNMLCSTFTGCPNNHLNNMDQNGVPCGANSRVSICPCE